MLTHAPKPKPPQQKSSPHITRSDVPAQSVGAPATFAHNFSRIPVHAPAPILIQPKLTVNTPGDIYEQEADQLAEQVMRMPEPQLQRACARGGDCAKCQTTQSSQDPPHLQTKSIGSSASAQTEAPPIVHEVLASPGQPLDKATRAFMEPRFGHDFSQVRVHTDTAAAKSAQAMNALAYTVGRNVVFDSGLYTPQSNVGRNLLAHELSHVLQQKSSQAVQRKTEGDIWAFVREELIRNQNLEPEIVQGLLDNIQSGRKLWFKGSNDQEVANSIRDHVAARKGVVDFAAVNSFAYAHTNRMNPEYWEEVQPGQWSLKDESKRKEAYLDMHKNPDEYALGCKAATAMTMNAGSGSAGVFEYFFVRPTDWIPGDWGYIKNTGTDKPDTG